MRQNACSILEQNQSSAGMVTDILHVGQRPAACPRVVLMRRPHILKFGMNHHIMYDRTA